MKKIIMLLIMALPILVGCSKEEEEGYSWKKSELIGTWVEEDCEEHYFVFKEGWGFDVVMYGEKKSGSYRHDEHSDNIIYYATPNDGYTHVNYGSQTIIFRWANDSHTAFWDQDTKYLKK